MVLLNKTLVAAAFLLAATAWSNPLTFAEITEAGTQNSALGPDTFHVMLQSGNYSLDLLLQSAAVISVLSVPQCDGTNPCTFNASQSYSSTIVPSGTGNNAPGAFMLTYNGTVYDGTNTSSFTSPYTLLLNFIITAGSSTAPKAPPLFGDGSPGDYSYTFPMQPFTLSGGFAVMNGSNTLVSDTFQSCDLGNQFVCTTADNDHFFLFRGSVVTGLEYSMNSKFVAPEPASWTLIGAGLALLLRFGTRRVKLS